jgi:hypothetical protein
MEYDKRVDYEKYEHVWLGMVKKYGEAVIFKDKVLIEEFPEPEYGTQFFFGADWGYAVDPTCLIRMFMKENTLYIDHEFYAVGVEINELPQAFESVPQSKKWKIVADNARPETISYLYNRGFNIEGSKKGKGSVEDGIQFLRSFEKIIIHPRCKGTIGDFKNYKWKQDKATNEILPIPVDSSNHAPDACLKRDTLVLTSKGEKKICEIEKGEEVLTRVGFKKVLWSGIVGKHAKVVKVKTKDGKSLICTPEHRILKSSCFTRADALRYDDKLLTLTQEALRKTQLNTRGRFIGDIQNQKGGQTDYIISENVNIFIEKCGKTIMEEFPEINISIIKMVTRQIIESKILNAAPQKNILVSTNGQRIKEEKIENSYTPLDILLHNGIKRQRAESFIKRLEDYLIKTEIKNIKSANFVVRDSSIGVEHPQSSAQTNVNQHGEENQESITLSQYVNIVEGLSSITNIKKLKPVQDRVLTVYDIKERVEVWDLTIQDQPEFFANRILVHNSRYALEAYIKKSNQAGVFVPDWKMPNLQGR